MFDVVKVYGRCILANTSKKKSKIENYVENEIKKFSGRPNIYVRKDKNILTY